MPPRLGGCSVPKNGCRSGSQALSSRVADENGDLMAAPQDCSAQLLRGMTPGQIAARRGCSLKSVLGYLDHGTGAGYHKRSDIYRSIPIDVREMVDKVLAERGLPRPAPAWDGWTDPRKVLAVAPHLEEDDVQVCLRYGPTTALVGDLFQETRDLEMELLHLVRRRLIAECGDGEAGWWRSGVPVGVRKSCAIRREEYDGELLEPWRFMDLMDFWEIIDNRWKYFQDLFRAPETESKPSFKRDMLALNDLRNRIAHPVREMPLTEGDFDLVVSVKRQVEAACSRLH